ncbi:MAG TPA: YetF domain-containing protein [Thermodesulfobacteriota bacterium]
MDSVVRGLLVYAVLLVLVRICGKRTLSQTTTFDFVLLLIIAEATQEALIGADGSMTNAALLVVTLLWLDVLLSLAKQRFPNLERWIDGLPVVLIEDGRLMRDRMDKVRVDEADILEAAHDKHGLERLDQVKHAILERGGKISVVPWR